MRHSFKTFDEAAEAGYRRVNRAVDKDISGPNSFGYQFQDEDGHVTVDVHLSEEKNQMGQLGCYVAMYPPK